MVDDLLGGLMRYQVGLWLIGGALAAFILTVRAFAKRLMREMEQRFERIDRMAAEICRVDRELSSLRAEMPVHYLRREDHVRDMAAITMRLDRIHEMLIILLKRE